MKLCCKNTIHSSAEIISTKSGEIIHVAPAISWLRFLLLVVAVAGRWPVSFRSVKESYRYVGKHFMALLSKRGQTPDKTWQSLFTAFPGDSFPTSFTTLSQATVLPFSQPGGCRMYSPGLTFSNSPFCPQSAFMCFIWISEQTSIISLYNIN
jgi:hypothetical protein